MKNMMTRMWAAVVGMLAAAFAYRFDDCVALGNVAEGDYERGILSQMTDEAFSIEHLLCAGGTDSAHVKVADLGDVPLFTGLNVIDAAEEVQACRALGTGAVFMVINGAVDRGAEVFGADGGKVSMLPATPGTYQRVGRALQAGTTDGDLVLVASQIADAVVVS